jgi:hypothetical protein
MLSKNKCLLILFLILFIGCYRVSLCSLSTDNSLTASTINQNIDNNVLAPDLNSVATRFRQIRNIPYNVRSMNCKTKSELFAEYLEENGAQNICIVTVVHSSGTYSHEFVEWNGHFYDMCNNEVISYTYSKEEYLLKLQKIGFTGVTVESPYPNS